MSAALISFHKLHSWGAYTLSYYEGSKARKNISSKIFYLTSTLKQSSFFSERFLFNESNSLAMSIKTLGLLKFGIYTSNGTMGSQVSEVFNSKLESKFSQSNLSNFFSVFFLYDFIYDGQDWIWVTTPTSFLNYEVLRKFTSAILSLFGDIPSSKLS